MSLKPNFKPFYKVSFTMIILETQIKDLRDLDILVILFGFLEL